MKYSHYTQGSRWIIKKKERNSDTLLSCTAVLTKGWPYNQKVVSSISAVLRPSTARSSWQHSCLFSLWLGRMTFPPPPLLTLSDTGQEWHLLDVATDSEVRVLLQASCMLSILWIFIKMRWHFVAQARLHPLCIGGSAKWGSPSWWPELELTKIV